MPKRRRRCAACSRSCRIIRRPEIIWRTHCHLEGKTNEAEALFAQADKAATETRKSYPRTWLAAVNLAALASRCKSDCRCARRFWRRRAPIIRTSGKSLVSNPNCCARPKAPLRRFVSSRILPGIIGGNTARPSPWPALCGSRRCRTGRLSDLAPRELARRARSGSAQPDRPDADSSASLRGSLSRTEARGRAPARRPPTILLLSDILEKMGQTAEARNAIAEVARLEAIGRAEKTAAN